MPIGLGLGSSHGGSVFLETREDFERFYVSRIRQNPQPPQAGAETPEMLEGWGDRIKNCWSTLEAQIRAYDPELLIVIGGDQDEMFDTSNVPSIMMYLGESAWAYNSASADRRGGSVADRAEEDLVRFKVDVPTSRMLLNKLVAEEGFDVAFSAEMENLGHRSGGLPHAFHRPIPAVVPNLDIPMVVLYENTYTPPSLSGERCYQLGQTLARLLKDDPRRIAIYGSGGLSHSFWPAPCWVDVKMDNWLLDRFAAGKGHETTPMFRADGHTFRNGTGEIRAWITVAGAMEESGAHAVVVDHLTGAHANHGLAWAYWPQHEMAVR